MTALHTKDVVDCIEIQTYTQPWAANSYRIFD